LPFLDKVRIGISGWNYPPWRGKFYPEGLAHRRELSYAAGIFPTIEINGTVCLFGCLLFDSNRDTELIHC
jgi:hypothetical protein